MDRSKADAAMGRAKSQAKTDAARANAKKGGWRKGVPRLRKQFWGTGEETYYVASDGSRWCVQSPDLVGRENFRRVPTMPPTCVRLDWQQELADTAQEIEAEL